MKKLIYKTNLKKYKNLNKDFFLVFLETKARLTTQRTAIISNKHQYQYLNHLQSSVPHPFVPTTKSFKNP